MEPNDFLDPNATVYKYDQIITQNDLIAFIQLLDNHYSVILPHNVEERQHLLTAIKTAETLLDWIVTGKNRDFYGML